MSTINAEEMTAAAETDVPESPMCRHLRSKKYFFLESMPLTETDMIGLDNHCWCRHTQQVVGPDGGKVRPPLCGTGRAVLRVAVLVDPSSCRPRGDTR